MSEFRKFNGEYKRENDRESKKHSWSKISYSLVATIQKCDFKYVSLSGYCAFVYNFFLFFLLLRNYNVWMADEC